MHIIISENFATGEGATVCILITKNADGAVARFAKLFGPYGQVIPYTKENYKKYCKYMPEYVQHAIESEVVPGAFEFYSSFHINYS